MSETIEQYMRTLKLGGLSKDWRRVVYSNTEQYVRELLELELKEREANRINRMVKTAGFRVIKTSEDFEWKSGVALPNGLSRDYLENLDFLSAKENLILMGAVGTGKTHLATALALKACQRGQSVRFFTAASLGNTLLEKNSKGALNSFLKTFKKVELLVIDEFGFVPLHRDAAELFKQTTNDFRSCVGRLDFSPFQVVSECYESKSLIIMQNAFLESHQRAL